FKHAQGLGRWRIGLSIALPAAAILWIGGAAAAGSRKPYSAGLVSRSHAFAEARCQVCHAETSFRRHTTQRACLTGPDAPAHAANQTPPPACSTCHRDHRGRVELSKTDDRFCVECHGDLRTTHGDPKVATSVKTFPSGHPEFAAGRLQDPGRVKFNHAAHMKDTLRGPRGPETLTCGTCHTPEIARTVANPKRRAATGWMA